MEWLKELQSKYNSGVAHQFIIHLNVKDEFPREKRFLSLDSYLGSFPPFSEAGLMVFYNRGTGLRFFDKAMPSRFLQLLGYDTTDIREIPVIPQDVLKYFDELLHLSWEDGKVIDLFGQEKCRKMQGKPLIAVIIEYSETLVPPNSASDSESNGDRDRLVIFEEWARDQGIRQKRNMIVMVADALISLASPLSDSTSGIIPLKISIPDLAERKETIEILRDIYPPQEEDLDEDKLVKFTAGLNRIAIKNIVQEASFHNKALNAQEVFDKKKKILEDQSRGLIKIIRSPWGIETIGALKEAKEYMRRVVQVVEMGKTQAIPMGLLLVGAPGTGKSVFPYALSNEIDWPLAILGDFRSMWYGEAQKQLEFIMELIRALTPVIVFVDEIDLMMAARGAVSWGDAASSTESQLMGKFFQFMSDTTLRGKVIWIGATNRPDRLDVAMIRAGRFDALIPFTIPSIPSDRKDIILALLKKNEIDAKNNNTVFQWKLTSQELDVFAERAQVFFSKSKRGLSGGKRLYKAEEILGKETDMDAYIAEPYTGAEIENIIRDAYFTAQSKKEEVLTFKHINDVLEDYLPARNFEEYRLLNEMALSLVTHIKSLLPEGERKKALQSRQRSRRSQEEI